MKKSIATPATSTMLRQARTLRLDREIIRELSNRELSGAVVGGKTTVKGICSASHCVTE